LLDLSVRELLSQELQVDVVCLFAKVLVFLTVGFLGSPDTIGHRIRTNLD